jgi:hypothetical protein
MPDTVSKQFPMPDASDNPHARPTYIPLAILSVFDDDDDLE